MVALLRGYSTASEAARFFEFTGASFDASETSAFAASLSGVGDMVFFPFRPLTCVLWVAEVPFVTEGPAESDRKEEDGFLTGAVILQA